MQVGSAKCRVRSRASAVAAAASSFAKALRRDKLARRAKGRSYEKDDRNWMQDLVKGPDGGQVVPFQLSPGRLD